MTKVYFVRHAESTHPWGDDRTRPLTQEGMKDSKKAVELLNHIPVDVFVSSPYIRSIHTISESAAHFGMEIILEERFRERRGGKGSNNSEMFRKRWADFNFCEQDGETLGSVQKRNIEALTDIITKYQDKNIVIGTHGTALSTILNYYDPTYRCDSFLRIINFMPYIIRMDFNELNFAGKEELLIIKKEFKG